MDLDALEYRLQNEDAEPTDLPLSVLKLITKDFSDDLRIGKGGFSVVYKGLLGSKGTIAVKKLEVDLKDIDGHKYNKEVDCLMRVKHQNIVRFLGYCADTQRKMFNHDGKRVMADISERLLCFEYLPNGSLDRFITDTTGALDWRKRFKIIKGICEGLHYLHQQNILHLDLKPANILLDENMVPKISDFGLSRCFEEETCRASTSNVAGSLGYLSPESLNGKITKKADIYSLGVIIADILAEKKEHSPVDKVLESWRNKCETISDMDLLLDQVRLCAEISTKCVDFDPDKRPDIHSIIEMLFEIADEFSQELLQIYPFQLRFPFEPNKETCCPVNLINKTDKKVYFSIIPSSSDRFADSEKLNGVVSPYSTLAVIVRMMKQQDPPPKMDQFRILMNTSERLEERGVEREELLMASIYDPSHATAATKQEAIYNDISFGQVESMDVHPTNPWIVTGHSEGYVCIWKMKAEENTYLTRYAQTRDIDKLFVKNTTSTGFTSTELKRWIWDDKGWVCIREWPLGAHQVTFNPKSIEPYVIVLDSKKSEAKCMAVWRVDNKVMDIPSTNASQSTCVAYCLHKQYIAIGHNDGHTEILEERSNKYLHALKVANSGCVVAVACHPTLPLIVTGRCDGNVYFWNCTTYRLAQALSFGHGKVMGFGFIDLQGIKRLVVGFPNTIEAVELNWATLARQE